MTVQSVSRDFADDVPADVRAEAFVEEAKRVLYTFGVLPEEYHKYYAEMYAKDANREGKQNEAKGSSQATDL
jgi:hypothetical protein